MYKLLLEMLATTMRKIFMICDETIRTTGFDRSLLATKVNRLLDILREYKPEVIEKEEINYNNRNDTNYVSWYKVTIPRHINQTNIYGFRKKEKIV